MNVTHFWATLHSQAELMFIELNQIVREIRKQRRRLTTARRSAVADCEKNEDCSNLAGRVDSADLLVALLTVRKMATGCCFFATDIYTTFCIVVF